MIVTVAPKVADNNFADRNDPQDPRVTKIDTDKVKRVYSGHHGCQCGCRGKYSENQAVIKRIVRNAMATGDVRIDKYGNVYAHTETRQYAIYFNDD